MGILEKLIWQYQNQTQEDFMPLLNQITIKVVFMFLMIEEMNLKQ